ncbi:MAG: glycosyltransferase family 4 protein [Solirubrobacterales bacterium]
MIVRSDPDALVACPPESPSERFARRLGARTIALPFYSLRHSGGPAETVRSVFRGLRGARDLRRILRSHPEHRSVYAIGIRSGLLAALASIGLRRRVVWLVPDHLPPRPLRPLVRLVAWLRVDLSLSVSRYITDGLVGRSRRLARRTHVVYPGIELSRFTPASDSSTKPVAAILGHISPVKRTDLAFDVTARVREEVPDFGLRVGGEAKFREEDFALERELRARAASDPGLRDAVEFTGRAGVVAVLTECAMLLHCRPDEAFGMVLIEAMALGLPVVAPAAGGPLEIVEEGVTGLLFRPGDATDAADKVIRLLADPELMRTMGAAARARVERHFETGRQLERTWALLNGRGAPASARFRRRP